MVTDETGKTHLETIGNEEGGKESDAPMRIDGGGGSLWPGEKSEDKEWICNELNTEPREFDDPVESTEGRDSGLMRIRGGGVATGLEK